MAAKLSVPPRSEAERRLRAYIAEHCTSRSEFERRYPWAKGKSQSWSSGRTLPKLVDALRLRDELKIEVDAWLAKPQGQGEAAA